MLRVGAVSLWVGTVLLAAFPAALAQDAGEPGAAGMKPVTVILNDGSVLVARIVSEDEAAIQLVTESGVRVSVPRSAVRSLEPREPSPPAEPALRPSAPSRFSRSDPNATRLMFAPTGRPLGQGEGQFADYYALFPGFSFGLTDNLSLMAGVSLIPGISLSEQAIYLAPRLAFQVSDSFSFSTGLLYATAGGDADRVGAGIAFVVATFGRRQASLSAGFGFGYVREEGDLELSNRPIVMLGGELQLTNNLALLSENWLVPEAGIGQQPFGLALRFFGERLSADFGVILVGEALEGGVPIPWLSFSYRFGRKHGAAAPHGTGPSPRPRLR